eukprot:6101417-Prymnesium_polylepis.1
MAAASASDWASAGKRTLTPAASSSAAALRLRRWSSWMRATASANSSAAPPLPIGSRSRGPTASCLAV